MACSCQRARISLRAESSVGGSVNLPAPTLISVCPRSGEPDGDRSWHCVQGRAGVWKDATHTQQHLISVKLKTVLRTS